MSLTEERSQPFDSQATTTPKGDKMSKKLQLAQSINAFIDATNTHHSDEFLATLSESAVITDEGKARGLTRCRSASVSCR
jgi:hypothetical protein